MADKAASGGVNPSIGSFHNSCLVRGNTVKAIDGVEIVGHSMTHIGNVREENQDAIRTCNPDDPFTATAGHLYAIADGMGGYSHGGVASTLALETFFQTFYAANGVSPLEKLRVSIQNANLSVFQTAQRMGVARMGTTLTAVNILGPNLYIGHIGDSRVYLIREDASTCLTNDHTKVGDLVRMHLLSADKVRTHSQRSVLNKCLGLELFVQPDVFKISAEDEDMIVLCTDGIWAVIEDQEFAGIRSETKTPEKMADRLVELALGRDSDDNLSVIVLHLKRLVHLESSSGERQMWYFSKVIRRIFK